MLKYCHFWGLATDTQGNVLPNAHVYVGVRGTDFEELQPVYIYEDGEEKDNPFICDVYGRYDFWADCICDIKIVSVDRSITIIYTDVFVLNPANRVHRFTDTELERTMYRKLLIDRSNASYLEDTNECIILRPKDSTDYIPQILVDGENVDGDTAIAFMKEAVGSDEKDYVRLEMGDARFVAFKDLYGTSIRATQFALPIEYGIFYGGAGAFNSIGQGAPIFIPMGTTLKRIMWAHDGMVTGVDPLTFNIFNRTTGTYLLTTPVTVAYNTDPQDDSSTVLDYCTKTVKENNFEILQIDILTKPTNGIKNFWVGLYGYRPIFANTLIS